MELVITQRQEALLTSIIKEYVETAEPVSSKFLEKSGFFDLSSASIRGEMNDLEGAGFLTHLYTSSGRVPTDKAYRYFVDNLIESDAELPREHRQAIKNTIQDASDDPWLVNKAIAQLLSDLSDSLVITNVSQNNDFYKIGLSSLFDMPDFRALDKAFRLTHFFDEFETVFAAMEKEFFGRGDEFRVTIGRENPVKNIKEETVISARYNLPQNYVGTLTMVGPMRMDYKRNIGLVKYTKEMLDNL